MGNTAEYVIRLKDLASGSLHNIGNSANKADKDIGRLSNSLGNLGGNLGGGIGAAVGGYFALSTLKDVGNQMIDVRAEFQKFDAVLSNSLGSQQEAGLQLSNIQKIAAKTPFAVQELSDSFVKLVNQGFKPTTKEMISLGDLASSTGKSFNQLSEAIIDAQVGEFERLKEFGIRAEKHGDKVRFTFKGVTKEVKFSSEAIREYITGLGGLEGVAGSMDKISQTLGGSISNLGDSWGNLLNVMGSRTDGFIGRTIQSISEMLNQVSDMMLTAGERGRKNRADDLLGFKKSKESEYATLLETARSKFGEEEAVGMMWKEMSSTRDQIEKELSGAREELFRLTRELEPGVIDGFINNLSGRTYSKEDEEKIRKVDENIVFLQEKLKMLTEGDIEKNVFTKLAKKEDKTTISTKSKDPSSVARSSRPTTINIDIGSLIENLTFKTEHLKDTTARIKEEVAKVLIGVVNDSQRVAGR